MFGIVSRRCASASRRVWATPPLSVGSFPLALSAVFGAGTARGKSTKSVELADFLAEIGVPEQTAAKMAGIAQLQKYRVSTIRTNYTGLVATLGTEGALGGILKSYSLLMSPPDTISGAHEAWVTILGADGAAAAILKTPNVLISPGDNIKGAQKALEIILGADRAAAAIIKSPQVLMPTADTMKSAHQALVDILGADRADETILKNPAVLRSPGDNIKGAHTELVDILGADGAAAAICSNFPVVKPDVIKGSSEALAAHLGKEDMLKAVRKNPILLRLDGDKIHQTAAAIKGLLGDSEGTALLKEKPRLFQSLSTIIEGNFQILCDAFDRELVLKAVRVRPNLLSDRPAANKAVKAGKLPTTVR